MTTGLDPANPRGTFCDGTNGEMEMQVLWFISHSFAFRFPRFEGRVTVKGRRGNILPSLGRKVLRDLYVGSRTFESTWMGGDGDALVGVGGPLSACMGRLGLQASFGG